MTWPNTIIHHSRPRFWLYLAGPVLLGGAFGASQLSEFGTSEFVLLLVYFLLPANVYLYGINDIFDATIDRTNPKKHGPERYFRGERSVILASLAGGGLGIALLLIVPWSVAIWIAAFLVLAFAYSAPPFRLKARPVFDSLSNGLYILPAVAAYVALAGTLPPYFALIGGWSWAMAMHTFSAIPDIEADRTAGIQTTATVLGYENTMYYCLAGWLLSAICFMLIDLRIGSIFLIYPLLLGAIQLRNIDIDRAYWWYPWVNGGTGMVLTLGGLWGIVYA